MESTRNAPLPPDQRATTGKARRPLLALGLLVTVVAVVAPAVLLSRQATRFFRVGPTLLTVAGTDIGANHRFGPLAVRRGHYYQAELRATGTPPFVIHLDYQDGGGSKRFHPGLSFDEAVREMDPIIRATRDDPAAVLSVEIAPDAAPALLRLQRLEIHEIRGVFYVWRAAVRTAALFAAFAGLSVLARQCYLHWTGLPDGRTAGADFRATRRAAAWAAVLLTLAGGFGIYVLQDQYVRLFRQPPRPAIVGWDGSFYYFWLRSPLVEGDFDFAKDLRYCNSMPLALREDVLRRSPRTKLGLMPDKYPIGWALFELPWYEGADVAARIVNAAGGTVRRDGWQPLYQVFLILG